MDRRLIFAHSKLCAGVQRVLVETSLGLRIARPIIYKKCPMTASRYSPF